MERKIIRLTTREDLNVYMSPARQALLRALSLAGGPLTPKALSDRLGVSPSSVQHHLKKLLALGVVEIDHQAVVNGITATYYKPADAEIRVGLEQEDGLRGEREALSTAIANDVLQGFYRTARSAPDLPPEELTAYGEFLSGALHLAPEERRELLEQVRAFLDAHSAPEEGRAEHWSFVLVAYRAGAEE